MRTIDGNWVVLAVEQYERLQHATARADVFLVALALGVTVGVLIGVLLSIHFFGRTPSR